MFVFLFCVSIANKLETSSSSVWREFWMKNWIHLVWSIRNRDRNPNRIELLLAWIWNPVQRSVYFEAIYGLLTSPKKTNGQICFVCFFTLHDKQIKFVRSSARQSAFWFYLTFSLQLIKMVWRTFFSQRIYENFAADIIQGSKLFKCGMEWGNMVFKNHIL